MLSENRRPGGRPKGSKNSRPRGSLTIEMKKAIISLSIGGKSTAKIVEELGLYRRQVTQVLTEWKKIQLLKKSAEIAQTPANLPYELTYIPPSLSDQTLYGFRNRLIKKSIIALERGLDCQEDTYKSAALAIATLKETGSLAPGSGQVDEIEETLQKVNQDLPEGLAFPLQKAISS